MLEAVCTRSTADPTRRRARRTNSRQTIDLASWHRALAKAKLKRPVKATGLLLVAQMGATGKIKSTCRKLVSALGVKERTLADHLHQLKGAGLIEIIEHHNKRTGWHTNSTYRVTLPPVTDAAASATDVPFSEQTPTSCMRQAAKNCRTSS